MCFRMFSDVKSWIFYGEKITFWNFEYQVFHVFRFFSKNMFFQKNLKTSWKSSTRERSFGGTFVVWTYLVIKLQSFCHGRRQKNDVSRTFRSAREIYGSLWLIEIFANFPRSAFSHDEMTVTFLLDKFTWRKYHQTNTLEQGFLMMFLNFFKKTYFCKKSKKLKFQKFKIIKIEIFSSKKLSFFIEKHAETHFVIMWNIFLVEILKQN